MKPLLDRLVDRMVASLSGEAQRFYLQEFGFFNEVTSISGKLKPYIKKTKAEKKVRSVICIFAFHVSNSPIDMVCRQR